MLDQKGHDNAGEDACALSKVTNEGSVDGVGEDRTRYTGTADYFCSVELNAISIALSYTLVLLPVQDCIATS